MKSFRERMLDSSARSKSRVVLALDVSGPFGTRIARAREILELTKDSVAAVKANYHILLPFGLEGLSGIVWTCKREGIPLIADLKMNDIEATNLNAVESLLSYGFDAVIANPFVGLEGGLGGVVPALHAQGGGLILLVFMSHKGASEGYGLKVGGEPLYKEFARRARSWGADGVVVSAKSPEKNAEVKEIVGKDCLIFSPGIGAQGGDSRAWASSGADFMIVGRTIIESKDPASELKELNGASA